MCYQRTRGSERRYLDESWVNVYGYTRSFTANHRAWKAGTVGQYTKYDIAALFAVLRGRCHWCNTLLDLTSIHVDHVIPLSRSGTNWPSNLTLTCPPCNMHKHNKLPSRWRSDLRLINNL